MWHLFSFASEGLGKRVVDEYTINYDFCLHPTERLNFGLWEVKYMFDESNLNRFGMLSRLLPSASKSNDKRTESRDFELSSTNAKRELFV
mmetsp:Transcript_31393/g.43707  ORF Transcript_31393/g.43707 Transcript_31393/m.43707 type:complete len:90 (-) Transcript_31393:314-583(-)